MKILGICSGSLFSGKEGVTVNVVKGWKEEHHEVKMFFSGWHDGVFEKNMNELRVENYPLKLGWYYVSKLLWSLDSLVHYPKALRQYLKIQKKFKPDLIYVDSYRPVVLLKPFLKGKVVLHVHDPHADSKVERFLIKKANKRIDRYIAVSNFIREDLVRAGVEREKITVVHNGIEIPSDQPKQYMPQGRIRIGIVGQVIPRKGHEDLIEACSLLYIDGLPFDLYIYGGGDKDFISRLKN
jgi:glycosyltransferase involved in cell wall biosynthesis